MSSRRGCEALGGAAQGGGESLSLAGRGTQGHGVADTVVLVHRLDSISEVFPILNASVIL